MSERTTTAAHAARRRKTGLSAYIVQSVLNKLRHGRLTCVLPDGSHVEGQGSLPGPAAVVELRDTALFRAMLLHGEAGFYESYIAGAWTSPDLTALLVLAALNEAHASPAGLLSLPARLLSRLRHAARANTRSGARRNIMAHYDLGNDFYATWLDPAMLYSSGIYAQTDDTLEAAQARKLALIADWLNVPRGGSVLEIGCGWGELARHLGAAGAQVTGLTISPAQLAHAQGFVAKAGLGGQVNLALRDYRDEAGSYDRIVSVEMLEAVGEAYWPVYFRALRARLKPGGRAVLQVITIDEGHFPAYRRTPDFIQRHIFPGGMLPTKTLIAEQARAAGLVPGRVRHFGASYARTLADWRSRFISGWPCIEAMGFDARFRRLWTFYLCYCEAGFASGRVDVGLYELEG
ncbi:MAG: cyclopropane-fatty-acyl-phospholipid synthase family protein [Rhodospirillales bacterium]|nr:cyclopropane-fatty-acyl-phospholipid synthase family protein [Rhodospirillales bacterium]MDE2239490.1 class I SAM-dependent methyltransferase [Rhodospirillales bacterium]